ncbi:MAG: ATP-binding protein, partial [Elusimicrobia bacterium]|nr:ATP-binding protein [Elusimicrobiota bacterium]
EERVRVRTAQLEAANKELEAFAYSVSHDLRAPLRAMDGFSQILMEDFAPKLEPECRRYLGLVRKGAQTMGRLIDDLLAFSRLGRQAMATSPVSMEEVVREVLESLADQLKGRQVRFSVGALAPCEGDASLLRQVWVNLLANAIKFTRTRPEALIEIDSHDEAGETVYRVKDNGVGFDMRHAGKLFNVFQRLHPKEEFEGTGVGLAIVARVVERHGGRVWARGELDRGAEFLFTLGGRKP